MRIVQLLLQHGADVHAKDKGYVVVFFFPFLLFSILFFSAPPHDALSPVESFPLSCTLSHMQ